MNIICGMHRSGTSVLCKILNDNNFDFGPKHSLIEGDKWNQLGYFEQKEIFKINEKLIKRNFTLRKLIYLFPGIIKKNIHISSTDREVLKKIVFLSDYYNYKFVKDNRFCLTLPLWLTSIQSVILCFRNPYEISLSLKKKYNLPIHFGLYIWRYHILYLIKNTKLINNKFYFFYDDLKNKKNFENLLKNLSMFYFANSHALKFNFEELKTNNNVDYILKNYNKRYFLLWNLIKKKFSNHYNKKNEFKLYKL